MYTLCDSPSHATASTLRFFLMCFLFYFYFLLLVYYKFCFGGATRAEGGSGRIGVSGIGMYDVKKLNLKKSAM